MSSSESMDRLANRFFAAIEQGDMKTLASMYSHSAVIWHNSDNRAQPQAENVAMLATLPQIFTSFAYKNVRRTFFDGGFVQQHDVQGVTVQGDKFNIHACMVVKVSEDKVVRIDEYLDSAQLPGKILPEISGKT